MAQKTTPKKPMSEDPRFAQAVQNYEAGLRAMQEHKFEKARGFLQKAVNGASKELADRVTVHLNTCNQHLERSATQFKSPEELLRYDAAHTLVPPDVARRLQKSIGPLPPPNRSWWRRIFGGSNQ